MIPLVLTSGLTELNWLINVVLTKVIFKYTIGFICGAMAFKKKPAKNKGKKGGFSGTKEKVLKIISGLKIKIKELKKIEEEIRKEEKLVSPQKTMELIEEIKVPSLEVIKEESKKSKVH